MNKRLLLTCALSALSFACDETLSGSAEADARLGRDAEGAGGRAADASGTQTTGGTGGTGGAGGAIGRDAATPAPDGDSSRDWAPLADALAPADGAPLLDAAGLADAATVADAAAIADAGPMPDAAAIADAGPMPDAALPISDAGVPPAVLDLPVLAACPGPITPQNACEHVGDPRLRLIPPEFCIFDPAMFCDDGPTFEGDCGCGCISAGPECGCPHVAAPVCEVAPNPGVTHLNRCEAARAGATQATDGPCDPESFCWPVDLVNTRQSFAAPECLEPEAEAACRDDETVINNACGCGCLNPGETVCPDFFDERVRYLSFSPFAAQHLTCGGGTFPFAEQCGVGCVRRDECPRLADPRMRYVSAVPMGCQNVTLECPAGAVAFNNACGCGCELPPLPDCDCPEPEPDTPEICARAPDGAFSFYADDCRVACAGAEPSPVGDGACPQEPVPPECGFGMANLGMGCERLCHGSEVCGDGNICVSIGPGRCVDDPFCPDCACYAGHCVDDPIH